MLSQVFDGQVERATWDYGEGAAGEAAAGSGTALQGALQPSVWAAQVKDVAASWSEKFAADYSRDSLAGLSAVGRSTLHSTQEFDAESTHGFALGAVAYLGEAMRRAGGGAWVHGDGERDPELDPFAGVPFLSRDEGAHLFAGAPYWGIYDFVDGDADSIRKAYDDYCSRGQANVKRRLESNGRGMPSELVNEQRRRRHVTEDRQGPEARRRSAARPA